MDVIRKPIKSRVNKHGDGQFISYHQPRCNNRNNIQDFHHLYQ